MPKLNESQKADALSLLQDLVRIDSTNVSHADSNARRAEEPIIENLSQRCQELGMEVRRHRVQAGRDNLTAHWPELKGRPTVAFQAHVDTVGAGGMTIDPFAADVRDGKLWGRGACDAKGSLATFLAALRIARDAGMPLADDTHLIATVGEETGCEGAIALMEEGFRVDACIVGEPTSCRVVTAHKGSLWFKLVARGEPSHAAMPDAGRNAIYALGRALGFIEGPYQELLRGRRHPLLDHPTISVGLVAGGQAVNIVAPRAEADVDVRYLPGQSHVEIARDFADRLRRALPDDAFDIEDVRGFPAMEADPDGPLVRNLLACSRDITGQQEPKGVFYFADSGPFHAAGIECVLFGPGDIAHAHKAKEFLDIEEYFQAIELVLTWLERHGERSMLD